MGVLSMFCAVLVSKVSCAAVVVKLSRIRFVVIRVLFAIRRFVLPFLDVCCFSFATVEY